MWVDIEEVLRLEEQLENSCASGISPVERDAKVNMLKYLQVQTVRQYEDAYDALCHELNKEGRLECLREIESVQLDLVQPKVLEREDCDEDAQLAKQLQFYLMNAERAKQELDKLVMKVAEETGKCEVRRAEVKAEESTQRKARRFCGRDVQKIADMARVTVICETPEAFKEVFEAIRGSISPRDIRRVANGFNSDWMPSGYRDVKVNPIVNEHLCEIQLQLRKFLELKPGQHRVYEWARELGVPRDMHAEDLFKNLSREVTQEMMRLARINWGGTENCLPDLQRAAGQYDQAEEGLRQQLAFLEAQRYVKRDVEDSGSEAQALHRSTEVAARLGVVLVEQGKYAEAEPLYEWCKKIKEESLGAEHPRLATTLNNLAWLFKEQGRYEEADRLYLEAIKIGEKTLGPDHPLLATRLSNRAELLRTQGNYAEAEQLYARCQKIDEKVFGPEHPDVAVTLNNRAGLLQQQGKYVEAGLLYESSHAIREKALRPDHPVVATTLNNRAMLLEIQGKYSEAEPLYKRTQEIFEKSLGPSHPNVATTLNNRAELLNKQGEYAEAEPLYERSQAIRKEVLGPDHPAVASSLNNGAGLLNKQGKFDEAEPLYEQCQAIQEKVLGPEHPSLASTLNNRAVLLKEQGKYAEAGLLYERSQAIREKALGPEHPDVANSLNNRALLLYRQDKYSEAVSLLERAFSILKKLGENHPETVNIKNNLDVVREKV